MNNNRLFNIIQTLYSYFQVSFYFWIYLLRGFVFYALIPVTAALFLTMRAIKEQTDDQGVKSLFGKYYREYEVYKLPSFLFSLLFSVLAASLFMISKWEDKPAFMLIIVIIILYILVLVLLLITYGVYFLITRELTLKQSLILSFVTAIKNFIISIGIIVIFAALLYSAHWNFAFFIIFSPFLYGLGITILFQKLRY